MKKMEFFGPGLNMGGNFSLKPAGFDPCGKMSGQWFAGLQRCPQIKKIFEIPLFGRATLLGWTGRVDNLPRPVPEPGDEIGIFKKCVARLCRQKGRKGFARLMRPAKNCRMQDDNQGQPGRGFRAGSTFCRLKPIPD